MTDAQVLAASSERFTLWLNADGKPVERALSEMTAGEVLAAIKWHDEYAGRLIAKTAEISARVTQLNERAEKESTAAVISDLTEEEVAAIPSNAKLLRECAAACEKAARLSSLIYANMPQWRGSKLGLAAAVHRYWPR